MPILFTVDKKYKSKQCPKLPQLLRYYLDVKLNFHQRILPFHRCSNIGFFMERRGRSLDPIRVNVKNKRNLETLERQKQQQIPKIIGLKNSRP